MSYFTLAEPDAYSYTNYSITVTLNDSNPNIISLIFSESYANSHPEFDPYRGDDSPS